MSGNDQQSKADLIAERQSNLPLPDEPPVTSDFKTNDTSSMNVGSGGSNVNADTARATQSKDGSSGIYNSASTDSSARTDGVSFGTETTNLQNVGRQAVEGRDKLPSDVVAGGAKDSSSVENTKGKDFGYPEKSDPAGSMDQTRRQ
ncbi:MAG: hypothetical protein M1828_004883 [Chrysothrix sp. TS-e1954]|nr:MAG: hypothetical protein M1828_004883 [Chrysothrix sp. TS-e1954]